MTYLLHLLIVVVVYMVAVLLVEALTQASPFV